MIPEETVERLRSETNIVELIGEHLELKRRGANWNALCPFHNEKSGSFNVNPQRNIFHCFGCQAGGDAIKWEMDYHNVDFRTACGRLAGRLGIVLSVDTDPENGYQRPRERRKPMEKREMPSLHDLDEGNAREITILAELRGLEVMTIVDAIERQFLKFCLFYGKRSWVVTDRAMVNAQARHLDGSTLFGKIKAQTIENAWAKWPLGSADICYPDVLLTEGGPDFLSALQLIRTYDLPVSPIGILGASMPVHDTAIPFLRGKRIAIAEHNDAAGRAATERWAEQLKGIAEVTPYPMPDDDLNDAIQKLGNRRTLDYLPYTTDLPF